MILSHQNEQDLLNYFNSTKHSGG